VRAPLRFGPFTFEPGRRELRRGEEPVPLPPKAFDLLDFLLERRPEAVSKAEIRDRVWPETAVSDASLPRLVNAIRAALGDDADRPRFVRTVHGFGYAFCGETAARERSLRVAVAHLVWGDRRIPLQEGESVIGRDPEADAWIDAATVSRRHARLVVTDDGATVEDLDSKNGTWVGTERVRGPHPLASGDEIRLGEISVSFRHPARLGSTRSASGSRRSRGGSSAGH
jgi:DNA-binding winged helix-turn-helix (wHTH) protein